VRRTGVGIVLLLALVGCGAAPAARTGELGKPAPGLDARLAALDEDPLAAPPLVEAARALLATGRAGEAHAFFLAARFLAENPPAGRPRFPDEYGRAIAREAAAAQRFAPPALTAERRARDEAARLFAAKDWAGALARVAAAPAWERDPRLARIAASCDVELAIAADGAGDLARATALLRAAANADASARREAVHAAIARVERRRAAKSESPADVRGALLGALRASPDDVETLWLLARAPGAGPAVAGWAREVISRRYPETAEARWFAAADAVRAAPDVAAATAIADDYAAKNPQASGPAAELFGLVAERGGGDSAREVTEARARYDAAREAARRSREALEASFTPDEPTNPH
jgi:hypothetical protein